MLNRGFKHALGGSAACLAVLGTGAVVAPSVAMAQDAEVSTAESGTVIVVTARRRGEDLARVPTSVAAIGSAALESRGIAQQADLQAAVPGLVVRETQSNNNLNYAIRGQTVDAFSGSSTAVIPYVNEVPFVAGGVASFFDLESIQVLKGPQGTLFGRNATGGAVLSTTARPREEIGGFVKFGYGNYDAINAEGALNIPLVEDKILFRGAFKIARRDGYIDNVHQGPVFAGNDNSELGKLHSNAFRGSLLLRPTDAIENLTVFQYERTKGNNSGTRIYSFNRCGDVAPNGDPLNCGVHSLFGPQLDGIFGPGAWAAVLAANPGYNPGGIQGALDKQNNQLGFWQVDDDSPSYHRGKDWFVTNTTTFDIGADTQIKNVFGYSSSKAIDSTGQTGEPFILITNYDANRPLNSALRVFGNEVTNKSLSNELQLLGKAFGGSVDYIIGGYYQQLKNHTIFPQSYFGLQPLLPPASTTSNWKSKDTTKALFGHITLDLGEAASITGLKLSFGGRYAWEKITVNHQPGGTFFPLTTTPFKDDRASWNVGLEYQATPDLMLYVVARESWRSGGINGVAPPFLSATLVETDKFKSEVAQDFEAGFKFSGDVGGRPARLFLSAYTMEVKNIQRALFPNNPVDPSLGSIAITVNVPKARIKGLELEAGISPAEWLEIGVNGALTDAKFTDNITTPFGIRTEFGPMADTPKRSGSAYAVITLPTGDDLGTMRLRGDIYAQSGAYFSNVARSLSPNTKLPGYEVVNFRFDWDNIAGTGFGVAAWVKNAFKEKYYVGGLPLAGMGVNAANVGRPRMYGAELKYTF